ncbi:MAG: helix-turn-helix domain-containing protein [Spirochaetota bacterium]
MIRRRLLLVGEDPYVQERTRISLSTLAGWSLGVVASVAGADRAANDGKGRTTVVLAPAAAIAEASATLIRVPTILYGSPSLIPAIGTDLFNDFLAEPWTPEELSYRLARVAGHDSLLFSCGTLEWGRLWLRGTDAGGRSRTARLTPTQFGLLDLLGRAGHEPVPREALLAVTMVRDGSGRAIDMQLSRLRRTIAEVTATWESAPSIRGYRGLGYRLEE